MTTTSGHVFVSHGSENRREAQELAAFLEGRGVRVWIAPRDVRPGMDYSEQLQSAIEGCTAFVVLVTDKANKSPYVRAETEMAFSTHKPIFPVRMSNIAPGAGLALFLKIRHWTDAFDEDRDANLDRLALELQALAGTGAAPAEAAAPPPTPAPPPPPPPPPTPAPPPPPPPPPQPAPPPPRAAAPPLPDEERLRAAVGTNADYYLDRWSRMQANGGVASWNWPACLANIFWMAWRKMWVPLAVVAGAFLLLGLVGAAAPEAAALTTLLSIGITFVTGTFGNHLYRRHVEALVAGTAAMDQEAALARLKERGGTSTVGLWATIGVVALLTALAIAGAAMQQSQDVGEREAQERVNRAFEESGTSGGDERVPDASGGSIAAPSAAAIVGRWTDDGNCASAIEFTADGRFLGPDGSSGLWQVDGDLLTFSGPGGSETVQIISIDGNSITVEQSDGSRGVSTRC